MPAKAYGYKLSLRLYAACGLWGSQQGMKPTRAFMMTWPPLFWTRLSYLVNMQAGTKHQQPPGMACIYVLTLYNDLQNIQRPWVGSSKHERVSGTKACATVIANAWPTPKSICQIWIWSLKKPLAWASWKISKRDATECCADLRSQKLISDMAPKVQRSEHEIHIYRNVTGTA